MREVDMRRHARELVLAWLLLTTLLICSLLLGLGWYGDTWVAELDNGNINVEWNVDPFWIFESGFAHGIGDTPFRLLPRFERHHYSQAALNSSNPFAILGGGDDRRVLLLPLWLPWIGLSLASGWILWKNRRKTAGHCHRCGYNLTGDKSGICPECGARI